MKNYWCKQVADDITISPLTERKLDKGFENWNYEIAQKRIFNSGKQVININLFVVKEMVVNWNGTDSKMQIAFDS